MPDNLNREQWLAVFDLLGFHPAVGGPPDDYLYNSDSKLRHGPLAVYFDMNAAVTLPIAVIRVYLLQQGFREEDFDRAVAAVGGDE